MPVCDLHAFLVLPPIRCTSFLTRDEQAYLLFFAVVEESSYLIQDWSMHIYICLCVSVHLQTHVAEGIIITDILHNSFRV